MRNQTKRPSADDEWQSPFGPSPFGMLVLCFFGFGLLVLSIFACNLPPVYDEAY